MGIPPYLPAEAVTLVVSQRLVRKVHECGRLERPSRDELEWFKSVGVEPPEKLIRPVGCAGCSGTGYRGRVAIAEVLEPTRKLKAALLRGSSQAELADIAVAEGFRPIALDGIEKINSSQTTVVEVARALTSATSENG